MSTSGFPRAYMLHDSIGNESLSSSRWNGDNNDAQVNEANSQRRIALPNALTKEHDRSPVFDPNV